MVGKIMVFLVLSWTFVYTVSYGVWTWKRKNRLGAVMVFAVAVAAWILPIYIMYFKE